MLIFLMLPPDFLVARIVSKETQHYLMINLRNLRQCPAGGFSFSEQLFSEVCRSRAEAACRQRFCKHSERGPRESRRAFYCAKQPVPKSRLLFTTVQALHAAMRPGPRLRVHAGEAVMVGMADTNSPGKLRKALSRGLGRGAG